MSIAPLTASCRAQVALGLLFLYGNVKVEGLDKVLGGGMLPRRSGERTSCELELRALEALWWVGYSSGVGWRTANSPRLRRAARDNRVRDCSTLLDGIPGGGGGRGGMVAHEDRY